MHLHATLFVCLYIISSVTCTTSLYLSSFGENIDGRLGNGVYNSLSSSPTGFTNSSYYPERVSLTGSITPSTNIISICAGYNHNIALDDEGRLHAWGSNEHHQLGPLLSSLTNYVKPTVSYDGKIGDPSASIASVCCGDGYTVVLDEIGRAWSWGAGQFGQLGSGDSPASDIGPRRVLVDDDDVITQISCGATTVLALTSNDVLYSWGYNFNGELGINDQSVTFSNVPVTVSRSSPSSLTARVRHMSVGVSHCLAVDVNGHVHSWGKGNNYRLGVINNYVDVPYPVPITTTGSSAITSSINIARVSAGGTVSLALSSSGVVYTWGFQILGAGASVSSSSVAVRLSLSSPSSYNSSTVIRSISAGVMHAVAIDSNGIVACWGERRQCGQGYTDVTVLSSPSSLYFNSTASAAKYNYVAASIYHTVIMRIVPCAIGPMECSRMFRRSCWTTDNVCDRCLSGYDGDDVANVECTPHRGDITYGGMNGGMVMVVVTVPLVISAVVGLIVLDKKRPGLVFDHDKIAANRKKVSISV